MRYCQIDCDVISEFDLFGKEPEFYYKGRPQRSSWFGQIFSVLYIILYIAFLVYKLVRMIQKVDIPIMILINKIDLLELDKDKIKIIYNSIDYKKVTQKHFIVKDISALKKVRLEESINWLYNSIMNDNKEEEENYYSNLV